MLMPQEMTKEEARRFLALSREAHWAFPSSQGNPILKDDSASRWAEQAVEERESYVNAARVLLENGDEEAAIEIASNVWRLWIVARDLDDGRVFLLTVLDRGEEKPSRARSLSLYGDGLFAFRQGKIEESRRRNKAALDAALAVDDPEALALAHLGLSRIAFKDGDYAESLGLAVKARGFVRNLDPAMGQAPLFLHASATRMIGEYDKAAALFEQSLELNRKIGDQGMVRAELQNLGLVEIHRGNVDAAERYFAESEKLGSAKDPYSAAMASLFQAMVTFARGNHNLSKTLLHRAESILKDAKMGAGPDDQFEIDWLRGKLEKSDRD